MGFGEMHASTLSHYSARTGPPGEWMVNKGREFPIMLEEPNLIKRCPSLKGVRRPETVSTTVSVCKLFHSQPIGNEIDGPS